MTQDVAKLGEELRGKIVGILFRRKLMKNYVAAEIAPLAFQEIEAAIDAAVAEAVARTKADAVALCATEFERGLLSGRADVAEAVKEQIRIDKAATSAMVDAAVKEHEDVEWWSIRALDSGWAAPHEVEQIKAEARREERARCAQIVETCEFLAECKVGYDCHGTISECLAAAIRGRASAPEGEK